MQLSEFWRIHAKTPCGTVGIVTNNLHYPGTCASREWEGLPLEKRLESFHLPAKTKDFIRKAE